MVTKPASRVFSGSPEVVSAALNTSPPHRIKAAHRRRRRSASGQSVQRYYDPAIGRFLSVDPVGPLQDPIQHFGRYHYANNNPYKYTDPDGRQASLNYNQPGSPESRAAERYRNNPGELSASGHGGRHHITDDRGRVGNTPEGRIRLDAEALASDFQALPEYTPDATLVILSCNAGNGENSLAQQVSDLTGNPTEASSGLMEGNPNNGEMTPFSDQDGDRKRDPGEERSRTRFEPRPKESSESPSMRQKEKR